MALQHPHEPERVGTGRLHRLNGDLWRGSQALRPRAWPTANIDKLRRKMFLGGGIQSTRTPSRQTERTTAWRWPCAHCTTRT